MNGKRRFLCHDIAGPALDRIRCNERVGSFPPLQPNVHGATLGAGSVRRIQALLGKNRLKKNNPPAIRTISGPLW